ncbi:MAG: sigma-70 family RNA polymerase sigma factor [Flavitalea sp.]
MSTLQSNMEVELISTNAERAILEGLLRGGSDRRLQEKRLYENFHYFIKQGTQKYSLPEEECASAYSDTIITVIDSVVSGKFERRSSIKSYAFRIFANKCVDALRKLTTNKQGIYQTSSIEGLVTQLPDKVRSIVQEIILRNEKTQMMQKLQELGEKCRQLLLYFEDGYSDKEISSIMQYNSAEVVKTSRLRCIEKLKEKITGNNRTI